MFKNRTIVVLALLFTIPFLLSACGGGDDTTSPQAETETETTEATGETTEATGTMNYVANFEGDQPKRSEADASGNSECGIDTVKGQEIVVNDNQTLRDVVISVSDGPSGLDAPAEEVSIDQENCRYQPHVITAKTNQTVKITDSDPNMHNVRATTDDGQQLFNLTTFEGDEKEVTFEEPGYVRLECNIHPWMEAWVYVTEHGQAEVTGMDGEAKLEDLPTGDYTFKTWHEEFEEMKHSGSVEQDKTLSIEDTFQSE